MFVLQFVSIGFDAYEVVNELKRVTYRAEAEHFALVVVVDIEVLSGETNF